MDRCRAALAALRLNLIVILAQALAAIGAYALARQLGAVATAASAAAVAFAVAPWRLGQADHLLLLSAGGIVLVLAMLARGHGVRWRTHAARPLPRPGWALAGWLFASWQLSLGLDVGLVLLYVVLGLVLAGLVPIGRPRARLLAADAVGGLLLAGLRDLAGAVVPARPNGHRQTPATGSRGTHRRCEDSSPPQKHPCCGAVRTRPRGPCSACRSEMALLPGFTLYALAAAGLLFSVWPVRIRLALLTGVVATIAVGLGTHGPAGGGPDTCCSRRHLPGVDWLPVPRPADHLDDAAPGSARRRLGGRLGRPSRRSGATARPATANHRGPAGPAPARRACPCRRRWQHAPDPGATGVDHAVRSRSSLSRPRDGGAGTGGTRNDGVRRSLLP